jgi:periplasmic protein TonB
MAYTGKADRNWQDKAKSGAGVVALHGALGYILLTALGVAALPNPTMAQASLTVINVPLPRPATIIPPKKIDEKKAAAEGASSAKAIKNRATPVVGAKVKSPNTITATDKTRDGKKAKNGASDEAGLGSGAGGLGDGTGSGNQGLGQGGGGNGDGNGGGFTPTKARKTGGEITAKDYRKATGKAKTADQVTVWYTVNPDGHVGNCEIAVPSQWPERDALTCRLIVQRWTYEPARDRNGNPVASETGWRQEWWPE